MSKASRKRRAYRTHQDDLWKWLVEERFSRQHFEFQPSPDWQLPSDDLMFSADEFQVEECQLLKSELNACKAKLNDIDIAVWHVHTRRAHVGGLVQPMARERLGAELCTQAWAKFYELLAYHRLVPACRTSDDSALVSVHLCEAPGGFITALNHYLKTTMSESGAAASVNWRWLASTLNPYSDGAEEDGAITDDRFIRFTRDRWYFCADNTGNLMCRENVRSLIEKCDEMGASDRSLSQSTGLVSAGDPSVTDNSCAGERVSCQSSPNCSAQDGTAPAVLYDRSAPYARHVDHELAEPITARDLDSGSAATAAAACTAASGHVSTVTGDQITANQGVVKYLLPTANGNTDSTDCVSSPTSDCDNEATTDTSGDLFKDAAGEPQARTSPMCDERDGASLAVGVATLVTADGSVDCQDVPGEQERHVSTLHFCEVATAIALLRRRHGSDGSDDGIGGGGSGDGGALVLKMFTMLEDSSICLLYLLNCVFAQVVVTKPVASKSGNSEVYVVCKDFRGVSSGWLQRLLSFVGPSLPAGKALFPLSSIPQPFIDQLLGVSRHFAALQMEAIEENLKLLLEPECFIQWQLRRKLRKRVALSFFDRYSLAALPKTMRMVPEVVDLLQWRYEATGKATGSYTERCAGKAVKNGSGIGEVEDSGNGMYLLAPS